MKNPGRCLQNLIQSAELEFLMEAHNGLSARIVEEAGFKGIWASGLSMSAQWGVRDNNEASWSQVVDQVEFMADAVKIPILLDGDTGYGNFNSMRRLVRKLEQRGIAGVCIEDKIFPKTNSFINGQSQQLADIEEFCGKIKAGKDALFESDFVIVARVEAFIAGFGLSEALKRAEAYRKAGADAILIHSAERSAHEVIAFKQEWGSRLPVIIVPTKYYTTPTEVFRENGFSAVIWANHLLRSSLKSMQVTAEQIFRDQSLLEVEEKIAPVAEVFRIQGEFELAEAEKKYLPEKDAFGAVILAASRGKELGELTADIPKCMVSIAGEPLLGRIADTYRQSGVREISVVTGYAAHRVDVPGIKYFENTEFAETGEIFSLYQAQSQIAGNLIISYGDVLFRKFILHELLDDKHDITVVVDSRWEESRNAGRATDYVVCSEPHSRQSFYKQIRLLAVHESATSETTGEWAGILKLSPRGSQVILALMHELKKEPAFTTLNLPEFLNRLIASGAAVHVQYARGHWIDVDTVDDVLAASSFS